MSIKIIKPGLFSTIQDLGRNGYRAAGIGPGGAMDFFAASVANYLVGNDENSPVIEMHFPAAEILFEEDALLSITGGNFGTYINEVAVSLWKPLQVKKNDRLSFKKYTSGARAYLAIAGGIAADNWLNSCSTHTRVKAGGFKGRAFKKEDIIAFNKRSPFISVEGFPDFKSVNHPVYLPSNIIRCISGPEWDLMNEESKKIFTRLAFSITTQSDRMGYRMHGKELDLQSQVELISSPVDSGTIQLLPNGQLIVLMADHQTTGGYPGIANVISADLPKLAQANIHANIHFELMSVDCATDALFSLYQTMGSIKNNCSNFYDAYRHQL